MHRSGMAGIVVLGHAYLIVLPADTIAIALNVALPHEL